MFVFQQEKKGHKHLLITDYFVLFHVLKEKREREQIEKRKRERKSKLLTTRGYKKRIT